MNNIKVENWCGYEIRFIEVDGEWYAILKDICDALGLQTFHVSNRLDPEFMTRVKVDMNEICDIGSNEVTSRARKTQHMLAVNEIGIYEALFASRRLEARKFRRWSATVMQKLRRSVGLEGFQVMQMTDPEVQEEIDDILDTLFYDGKTGKLMRSVTVHGGDVEQIPFEED